MSAQVSPKDSVQGTVTLVYDIEVVGLPWEEIDEETRAYLLARERKPERREAVPDRTALYPGLGRVIAIGVQCIEDGRRWLLLEQAEGADGGAVAEHDWPAVPGCRLMRGTEANLLARFWELAGDALRGAGVPSVPRLVTYNGRSFDGPVISIRSAQLGLPASRDLIGEPGDIVEHCDLMAVLDFHGARRPSYSLDYWCRRFGVESPKGGLDGSQVGGAYREGRLLEIGEYCMRDVGATAALYQRLVGTLVRDEDGASVGRGGKSEA